MGKYGSIYEAIKANDVAATLDFVKTSYDYEEDGGWTPLHEASRIGHMDVLQLLIERGFEVNRDFEITDGTSEYWGSALTEALLHNNLDAAKLLIKHGADVNANFFIQDYNTPEWFFGEYDLATNTGNCLMIALSYKDDELLAAMLNHGLDVDSQNNNDETAIYHAVSAADTNQVDTLLKLGANVNQYVKHEYLERVPLLILAVKEYLERSNKKAEKFKIINILLKNGPDLSMKCLDAEDETVMDFVIDSKDKELIRMFGLEKILIQFVGRDRK